MGEIKGVFGDTFWKRLEEVYYEKGGEPGTFDRSNVKSRDIFSPIVDFFEDAAGAATNTFNGIGNGLATVKKYAPIVAAAGIGLFILSRRK